MNTKEHATMKMRGSADVSYLQQTVDQMIWDFMQEHEIPGLTLAIVQAPYIPRVVGYGVADPVQNRLAAPNTMWPAGQISQAFTAVAVIQLYEDGKLELNAPIQNYLPELPPAWQNLTALQLLRQSSGLPDYSKQTGFDLYKAWSYPELVALVQDQAVQFVPGTDVAASATNFLLLTEIIERISHKSYREFVTERQIAFMGLKHTGFVEDLDKFPHEDVAATENVHQKFKADKLYIDPTEPAASYGENAKPFKRIPSSALRGYADIWASAQDISFWDIGLAGSVLIHKPENRALVYSSWQLPDGREIPAVAGWHFYKHRGLMDIKGTIPGFSCFLSRFTDPAELVCVTLLANKEGIDFTNLGRKIAGAFGDLLSTNYDDNRLYLLEGQLPVATMVAKLENELQQREIPLFAKFDHARNAKEAGLELLPTTVLVFGAPKVGTGLMQADPSISLELPLRISIWEDQTGSTWLAFPKMKPLAAEYGLENHPVIAKMQSLLEQLVSSAGSIY
ncbi:serine hydrolase [Phascolarctobacterium sp.]